jgi:hypothetical protein
MKTKSAANRKNVFIRKLKAKDNRMLDVLRDLTGYKSNARNLLKAGYLLLERNKQIAELESKIVVLEDRAADVESRYSHYREMVSLISDVNLVTVSMEFDQLKKKMRA